MAQIVNIVHERAIASSSSTSETWRGEIIFIPLSDGIMKAAFVYNVSMLVSIVLLQPETVSNFIFQSVLAFEIFSALLVHLNCF